MLAMMLWGTATAASCQDANPGMAVMQVGTISLRDDAGKIIDITAHIADDDMERSQGYQHICPEIIDKTTMLFVYARPVDGRFHMRNVKAALDIGFFDEKGRLVRVLAMDTYADGNHRLYHPGRPFQYALEARVGFFKHHHLSANRAWLVLHSVHDNFQG